MSVQHHPPHQRNPPSSTTTTFSSYIWPIKLYSKVYIFISSASKLQKTQMGYRVITLLLFSLFCQVLFVSLQQATASKFHNVSNIKGKKSVASSGCNLFIGSWVVNPSYPLYDYSTCPFIDAEFNCQKYGRPDKQYLKYSWKPDSCALPRYFYIYLSNNINTTIIQFSYTIFI